MTFYRFFLLAGLCTWLACGDAPQQSTTPETPIVNYPESFLKVMAAHGGKDTWDKMNTLSFTRGTGAKAENHTIDLKTRKSVIEVENKYKLGTDGEKIWVSPHRDSFPGDSPRFTHNLHFYFFAIPFVFADPGVTVTDGGLKMVDSVNYQVLNVRFGENVGDAPEDQYNMYVDPKTNIVDFITYSVTYFDKSRATRYNALKFDWEKVNGLLAPKRYDGYKWEQDSLGAKRYESAFDKVQYKAESQEDDFFAVPEGAYTE